MTNRQLNEQNAKMRGALVLIRRDLNASIIRFLNEAEHSAAVGSKDAQFAATVAAATVDGVLKTIDFHSAPFKT